MMFQVISVLLLVLIAISQLLVDWNSDSKKHGRLKLILLLIFVLSVMLTIYSSYIQYDEKQQTEEYNQRLLNEIDYLKGQQNDLLDGNRVLLYKFDDLKANQDTILVAVRVKNTGSTTNTIIPVSESQLVEVVDKRKSSTDPVNGLHHAMFVFRSRNVVPLRDIRIKMSFDKPIERSEGRIRGAFVTEQGTRDSLVSSTQYVYRTGYLSQSNYIIINVTSKNSIQLSKLDISP